jgi:hypothetical protein
MLSHTGRYAERGRMKSDDSVFLLIPDEFPVDMRLYTFYIRNTFLNSDFRKWRRQGFPGNLVFLLANDLRTFDIAWLLYNHC